MKRASARVVEQYSLFASSVGTFIKEGCLYALMRHAPFITDGAFLQELTAEVTNYRLSGNHVLNLVNHIIEADEEQRMYQVTMHRPGYTLSRDHLSALFEFRTAARDLIITLYEQA
jgi:hypothetical protein